MLYFERLLERGSVSVNGGSDFLKRQSREDT